MRSSITSTLVAISDHGPQFTSNLWLQLCEMLNISRRQTTAYHPESNGAVRRLHRRFKDVLRPRAAGLRVLLGLCTQPREDTGLSPAEAVFGAPIVLAYDFFQTEELSVDSIIKTFQKLWMPLLLLCLGTIIASSCPASCQPSSSSPPSSGSIVLAWSNLSSRSTKTPTPFCAVAPAPSPSTSGHGTRSSLSAT
jgi:hypothetical protein